MRTTKQTEETHTSMILWVSNLRSFFNSLSKMYVVLGRWDGISSLGQAVCLVTWPFAA